jgi:hypothetical protein
MTRRTAHATGDSADALRNSLVLIYQVAFDEQGGFLRDAQRQLGEAIARKESLEKERVQDDVAMHRTINAMEAGAYTRPLLSST